MSYTYITVPPSRGAVRVTRWPVTNAVTYLGSWLMKVWRCVRIERYPINRRNGGVHCFWGLIRSFSPFFYVVSSALCRPSSLPCAHYLNPLNPANALCTRFSSNRVPPGIIWQVLEGVLPLLAVGDFVKNSNSSNDKLVYIYSSRALSCCGVFRSINVNIVDL